MTEVAFDQLRRAAKVPLHPKPIVEGGESWRGWRQTVAVTDCTFIIHFDGNRGPELFFNQRGLGVRGGA